MQHYAASGSTLFVMVKKIFRQKNTIFFENFNLTPLDMYNGLSQVYYTKREGCKGLKNTVTYSIESSVDPDQLAPE